MQNMYQSLFQKYCKSNNFPISMTYRNECLFLTHMPMVWLRQCCSMCLSRAQVRKSWIRATYVFFLLTWLKAEVLQQFTWHMNTWKSISCHYSITGIHVTLTKIKWPSSQARRSKAQPFYQDCMHLAMM